MDKVKFLVKLLEKNWVEGVPTYLPTYNEPKKLNDFGCSLATTTDDILPSWLWPMLYDCKLHL